MLDDEALGDIHGQAMFVSDYRRGSADDGVSDNDFGFYRLMLNANLEFNLNIDKLQLGCGGVNEGIRSGCDIDIDYLRLMGSFQGTGSNPLQPQGAGQAGDPVESLFSLLRPYVEFAVTNPEQHAFREIAGIKIGSQQGDGFLSIGRYDTGLPGCSNPPNDPNCHMGINQFSGNMDVFMQGEVALRICTLPLICAPVTGDLEFSQNQQVVGTRMRSPVFAVPASGDLNLFGGIPVTIFSLFQSDLRMIHGIKLDNTQDFFMSFQRERITYPAFEEGTWADVPANAGWWMNLPGIELTGLEVAYQTNLFSAVGSLFGTTQLVNYDVGQRPANNCWGAAQFC
ncbi:MAG: hypothetical protein C0462_01685 [Alcanivorax sp.]|nr:hypothetical protein [Alcanivorax sp.]